MYDFENIFFNYKIIRHHIRSYLKNLREIGRTLPSITPVSMIQFLQILAEHITAQGGHNVHSGSASAAMIRPF